MWCENMLDEQCKMKVWREEGYKKFEWGINPTLR